MGDKYKRKLEEGKKHFKHHIKASPKETGAFPCLPVCHVDVIHIHTTGVLFCFYLRALRAESSKYNRLYCLHFSVEGLLVLCISELSIIQSLDDI